MTEVTSAFISVVKVCKRCRSLIAASSKYPRDVAVVLKKNGAVAAYYCDNCAGEVVKERGLSRYCKLKIYAKL